MMASMGVAAAGTDDAIEKCRNAPRDTRLECYDKAFPPTAGQGRAPDTTRSLNDSVG